MPRQFYVLTCVLASLPAAAQLAPAPEPQAAAALVAAATELLQREAQGLPGEVGIQVSPPTALRLPACPAPQASLPAGARAWGRVAVRVECREPRWRVFLKAQVSVQGEYAVTARALPAGQAIVAADLARARGDLAQLPVGVLLDPARAVGKRTKVSLPAGRPLRTDLLQLEPVVRAGEPVQLLQRGPGFSVSNRGEALNNAAAGQRVRVRLPSGKVMSGVAREGGIVEMGGG